MNENLLHYIKQRFSQKASEGDIIEELKKTGWGISDINIALAEAKGILPPPRPLPGPGELLKESFLVYRKKYKFYLGILLLPFFINVVPVILFMFFMQSISSMFASKRFDASLLIQYPAIIIGFFVWILALFIASITSQSAILYSVTHAQEENLTIGSSYKKGSKYIWQLLWIGCISGLLIAGGMFLFVIPGIIFSIWFSFSALTLFDQNIKGSEALSKSKLYVQGYFWPILGRMFFMTLISIIASFAISSTVEFIGIFVSLAGIPKEITSSFSQAMGSVVSYVVMPLWLIYWYKVYSRMKELNKEKIPQKNSLSKIGIAAIFGWILFFALFALAIYGITRLPSIQSYSNSIDLLTIQAPLSLYYKDNQKYPQNINELSPLYIQELPSLYKNQQNFLYGPSTDRQTYKLCIIENAKEAECVKR